MISHPAIGSRVQLHYGPGWRRVCGALHGKVGVVRMASKGKPRNHGVEVDGGIVVVPCECAISGGAVSQPNLTIPDSAKAQIFAARFNALCEEIGVRAGFLALMPSATKPGATSIQLGGEVEVCKLIERQFSRQSTYMGDHAQGKRR